MSYHHSKHGGVDADADVVIKPLKVVLNRLQQSIPESAPDQTDTSTDGF